MEEVPLRRHSVEEVVWHIEVVILNDKIPTTKIMDLSQYFGVSSNNFYTKLSGCVNSVLRFLWRAANR